MICCTGNEPVGKDVVVGGAHARELQAVIIASTS